MSLFWVSRLICFYAECRYADCHYPGYRGAVEVADGGKRTRFLDFVFVYLLIEV